jgi:Glycosyltransferase family 87
VHATLVQRPAADRALAVRLWRPTRLALTLWAIYVGPLVAGVILYLAVDPATSDFAATIYQPGKHVLAGLSPYPPAEILAVTGHRTFVYPPTLLAFDVPLALLPFEVARIVWLLASAGALAGALRILRVRDPRCYALALLSVPAIQGLALGNVTVMLVPLLALSWRYRDRAVAGGLAVGLLVAIKLLLWPLFIWLLATRRIKNAMVAAVAGGTAVLGSWALIGFNGMTDYPELLRLVGGVTAGPRALTVMTLSRSAGLPETVGRGLQWSIALALLAFAVRLARRTDGDRRAFSVVVVAALVVTPVAWPHYFLFLLVPIALVAPRLAPVWAIPWGFWLVLWLPQGSTHFVVAGGHNLGAFGVVPSVPKLILVLSLLAATLVLTAAPHRRERARERSDTVALAAARA